jgi:glycosyltransferase involved in cell wall biosynthesis
MNVLAISAFDSFWSMGEQSGVASFFDAAHAYVNHGHTVDVVLPGSHVGADEEIYHDMTLSRVPFGVDPLDVGPGGVIGLVLHLRRYTGFRRKTAGAAIDVSMKRRPDVVIGLGAHAAPVARTVARSCGVPNVTRLFGQSLILHMQPDGRIRNRIRFYANFPEILAFRTPCAALIMHNDGSRGDLVARRLRVPRDRFHFWRDGVDIPALDDSDAGREFRLRLGCKPDAIVAMSVGRFSPEKNLELVVDAFAHAAARVPALQLVFVGDGPSRSDVEERIRSAGVTERVRLAGAVTRDDLGTVFGAADFVVSLSRRTNMTNSTIEAMASGVPCVALDSGETAAVIQHGRTGLLVSNPAAHSIAEAMRRIATDVQLRNSLGTAAREFVTEEFERVEERLAREVDLVTSIARRR